MRRVLALLVFLLLLPDHALASLRWTPRQSDRWLYQLGDSRPKLDLCVKPQVGARCVKPTVWAIDLYAADGITRNDAAVRAIHKAGGRAVCYVSAGSWEQWRPDAAAFPKQLIGNSLDGWPGERWLDVRALDQLTPLFDARAEKCKRAGFDAIDWDNVDNTSNDTGFPIASQDQLAFNRMLSRLARSRGLAVGLKNDLAQISLLVDDFDFAVNEQCQQFNECALLLPFSKKGKAVVQIEYKTSPSAFCPFARKNKWSAMLMGRDLKTTPWKPCS